MIKYEQFKDGQSFEANGYDMYPMKGTVSINTSGVVFLCHDNQQMKGTQADDKKGHQYSWELTRLGSDYFSGKEDIYKLTLNNGTQSVEERTSMSNAIVKSILKKEDRDLIKAGFLSSDLTFTADGQKYLIELLFVANKKEMVLEAERINKRNETK